MSDVVEIVDYAEDNKYALYYLGCKGCEHLNKVGYDAYRCDCMSRDDGSSVYPIFNGEPTCDWGLCKSKNYKRSDNSILKFRGK